MRTSSTKNSLIIGISIVLGASLLSVGVSNAAGTTIKACAKKSGGAMRLIDSTKNCKKSERTLTWGTQGDAGATGATGATGSTGATGAAGASPVYLFGSFQADGTKLTERSSSAMPNATVVSTGIFNLTFPTSIANCSAVASPNFGGVEIAVVSYRSANIIEVKTTTHANVLNSGDFSIAIFCL
jgi:hypothetical protein